MGRFFLAFPPGKEAADSLYKFSSGLRTYSSLLKIVDPGNYHFTLKFIGALSDDRLKSLMSGLAEIETPRRIRFSLSGTGAFPSVKNPSVIWAGIKCDIPPLKRLLHEIESLEALRDIEKEKRELKPHLTLARVRNRQNIPRDLTEFIASMENENFCESEFSRLCLFSSDLRPGGPVYTELLPLPMPPA